MSESSKLTTITLTHGSLRIVGHILEEAGFELGTVGGGEATMERAGEISSSEEAELCRKMGEVLFSFSVEDLEDDSEDHDDE